MNNLFTKLYNYLKPNRKCDRVPRHIMSRYEYDDQINETIQLVMMRGYARSPRQAVAILRKHGVTTYHELSQIVPPPKTATVEEKLHRLARRWQGATDHNLYRQPRRPVVLSATIIIGGNDER